MINISTVGIVSTPKTSALETSRRELSEDVSFGIGTLLVVEQSSLENRPGGGVIYTVLYGNTRGATYECVYRIALAFYFRIVLCSYIHVVWVRYRAPLSEEYCLRNG